VVQSILLKLQTTVEKAKEEITNHLLPLLELQGDAVALQVTAHKLHLGVDLLFKNRYRIGLYKHAPALFSAAFLQQFNSNLWHDTWNGLTLMFQPDVSPTFCELLPNTSVKPVLVLNENIQYRNYS